MAFSAAPASSSPELGPSSSATPSQGENLSRRFCQSHQDGQRFGSPMPRADDSRRLEIVADGLPISVAPDRRWTLASSLHCDGTPHRGAANVDGAVLALGKGMKRPTLSWWAPCQSAFGGLGGIAKSREVPFVLQKGVGLFWWFRWDPSWRALPPERSLCPWSTLMSLEESMALWHCASLG